MKDKIVGLLLMAVAAALLALAVYGATYYYSSLKAHKTAPAAPR